MFLFAVVLALSPAPSPAPVTMGASSLSGQQILDKVSEVWASRPEPPYVAFTMPCHELMTRGAEGSCGSSVAMRVSIRTSDGMAHVITVPKNGESPVVLLPEGRIYGPAFAPLGFTRKLGNSKRVGSLAAEPLAPIETIASVTAINYAYDVTVAPSECNGEPAYQLSLAPRITGASHPLRGLLVDRASYRICQLTYALEFNGGEASVRYDFAYVGEPPTPSIVRIDAKVPYHSLIGVRYARTAENLQDIAFPTHVPGLP